jgi:hypothetical protein
MRKGEYVTLQELKKNKFVIPYRNTNMVINIAKQNTQTGKYRSGKFY